jgi:hypothetical protein
VSISPAEAVLDSLSYLLCSDKLFRGETFKLITLAYLSFSCFVSKISPEALHCMVYSKVLEFFLESYNFFRTICVFNLFGVYTFIFLGLMCLFIIIFCILIE